MGYRCPRPLAALLTIVFLSIPGAAQTGEIPTLKGEVHSDTPVSFRDYRVELEDLNRHGEIYRAELRLGGDFELRHVLVGQYQLRLMTLHGDIVQQEIISVNPTVPLVSLYFSAPRKTPTTPGTVSMTELRHPPDRKAIQSFVAARRFAASGNSVKAVEELEKAVAISPEFADAYTNLAAEHMRMRRFREGEAEMKRAIEIAGPNSLRLSNLAYAQLNLNLVDEALASARAAVRMDPGNGRAQLILGSILAGSRRTLAEAIPHLERAVESVPSAQASLDRARRELAAAPSAQQ